MDFSEIFSKENKCGSTTYFRNPKLSSMVGYSKPFSEHGIEIDGVPSEVLAKANFVEMYKDGCKFYSLGNGRLKRFA